MCVYFKFDLGKLEASSREAENDTHILIPILLLLKKWKEKADFSCVSLIFCM